MVKDLYFLISAILIVTSLPCQAMQYKPTLLRPEAMRVLGTNVVKPESVICLSGNIVAILGKNCCSLHDFSVDKEIVKLSNYTDIAHFQSLVVNPNKENLLIHRKNKLEIYDTLTRRKIGEKLAGYLQGPPIFMDDAILIGTSSHQIDLFNYKNNECKSYPLRSIPAKLKMAFNLVKQELLYTGDSDTITVLKRNKDSFIEKSLLQQKNIAGFKYSPDGLLIVIRDDKGCCIIDLESDSCDRLIGDNNTEVCAMAFHPGSSILATFPCSGKDICYWDTKTQKLITTTPLEAFNNKTYHSYERNIFDQRLDFSCDGTKLVVALSDTSLLIEVPFEMLGNVAYQCGTKDKALFAHAVLQRYLSDDNTALPQDMRSFLIRNLLDASKC